MTTRIEDSNRDVRPISPWCVLLIDMENGFVNPESPHCIRMAESTIPAIGAVLDAARHAGMPIVYVKRLYRPDGSDVELTRWKAWADGGRAMGPGSEGPSSAEYPDPIKPQPGDYLMVKPRWSCFFATSLDLILRRLAIRGVILLGTTTPNCIRSTAYDANSLDYEVIVVSDGTSSQTPEIQEANLSDMARMGARIMTSAELAAQLPALPLEGWVDAIRRDRSAFGTAPEPISPLAGGASGWLDKW